MIKNRGYANGGGSLIMGAGDIYQVYKAALNATIVDSHMEGVNHYTLTRTAFKNFLNDKKVHDRVFVPDDAEAYTF